MGKADCRPAIEVLVPFFLVSTAVLIFAFSFPSHIQLPEFHQLLCDTYLSYHSCLCLLLSLAQFSFESTLLQQSPSLFLNHHCALSPSPGTATKFSLCQTRTSDWHSWCPTTDSSSLHIPHLCASLVLLCHMPMKPHELMLLNGFFLPVLFYLFLLPSSVRTLSIFKAWNASSISPYRRSPLPEVLPYSSLPPWWGLKSCRKL